MRLTRRGTLPLLVFDHLSDYPPFVHAISTRWGGSSQPPFHDLNLSYGVPDDAAAVTSNRERLCRSLDLEPSAIFQPGLIHGRDVVVDPQPMTMDDPARPDADVVVLTRPGPVVVVTSADCVPVVAYDPVRRIAGAAHSGWRGTVVGATAGLLETMRERGSRSEDILIGIGPSIGPCCYQVGPDVVAEVRDGFVEPDELLSPGRDGGVHFDLWRGNLRHCLDAGVPEANVRVAELCTSCLTSLFFSHRGDRGRTGRFAAIVALRS